MYKRGSLHESKRQTTELKNFDHNERFIIIA